MTDDYEVIWDDTHEEPPPSSGDGDRVTYVVEGSDWSKLHHLVKVERKRQLPTKFGSVITLDGKVLLVRTTTGEWITSLGGRWQDSAIGPNWTLVRDGVE